MLDNTLAIFFLLLTFQVTQIRALASPGKGGFSKNQLDWLQDDNFEFRAFDVKRNDVHGSYVISASVKSTTGAPPKNVEDAPDIANMTRAELAGKRTGLIMVLEEQDGFGKVKWAYRIFSLPASASLRVDVSDGGHVFVAGATMLNNSHFRRSFASFSSVGRLIYSAVHGDENSKYTKIATSSTELYVLATYDTPGTFEGNKVGMDRLLMTSGIGSSQVLTPSKLPDERVIKSEIAVSVGVVFSGGTATYVVLRRRQTANKDDRNYITEDLLCSFSKNGTTPIACFSLPTSNLWAPSSSFELSEDYVYFARLVSSGVAESINMTRLDVRTLKPSMKDWGNQPATYLIPPAEGDGIRARSNLAAISVFVDERRVKESVRFLLTTSGTIDEFALPLKVRGRMAIVDFLPNGTYGSGFVDTSQTKPVQAVAVAALKRGNEQDAVAFGTITNSARGDSGQLYLTVFGDPLGDTRGKDSKDKDLTTRSSQACIGHDTHMNGISVKKVLDSTEGLRLQVHPLRWIKNRKLVKMLCFEVEKKNRVCATPLHVVFHQGNMMFVRDFCTLHGYCFLSMQRPLNFKGPCGSTLRVGRDLEISMHAADVTWKSAQQVVENECKQRKFLYPLWLLKTL